MYDIRKIHKSTSNTHAQGMRLNLYNSSFNVHYITELGDTHSDNLRGPMDGGLLTGGRKEVSGNNLSRRGTLEARADEKVG